MAKEITEFMVIAPASMGKGVRYVQDRIEERLVRSFPGLSFEIEAHGPLADPEEFTIIPMMGTVGGEAEPFAEGETLMDRYPPSWLLGAIKDVLREFELSPGLN